MAEQEIVNIGTLPNDGEGDPLRVAFAKINNNFTTLFSSSTLSEEVVTEGDLPNQVLWTIPAEQFTHGVFQIRSSDPSTIDSQDITIRAQITNDANSIKWVGYATTFNGNAIATYDMNVLDGNVRLLISPLVDSELQHVVSAQTAYLQPVVSP